VIILDASVMIAHLDASDDHHDRAVELLMEEAEHGFASSAVTVAEALVGPARRGRLEAARAALRQIGLEEIAVGPGASSQLATLRAETGLKLPDCCVLLAAWDAPAERVGTFDAKLREAASRLGLTSH